VAAVLDTEKRVLGALTPHGQKLVRDMMARRGFTVAALADLLDVSRKHLSQVLNGHVPVTGRLATDLPTALGMPPSIFAVLLRDRLDRRELDWGFAKDLILRMEDDPTSPLPEWACD
jgi:plasmid maintenance system antidote protein VapI